MLKIVVCVSGGGTNLQAILDALDEGKITNTQILGVLSNNPGAGALDRARSRGIPGIVSTATAFWEIMGPSSMPSLTKCTVAPVTFAPRSRKY